jgi:class 3 adenylate cyclase
VPVHLEVRLEHLLVAAGVPFSRPLRGGRGLDFLLRSPELGRVGVVVKDFFPRAAMLNNVIALAKLFSPEYDRFALVTPTAPGDERRAWCVKALEKAGITGDWLAANDVPRLLGLRSAVDLTSPEDVVRLERAALRATQAPADTPPTRGAHPSAGPRAARRDLDRVLAGAAPPRPPTKAERYRGLRRNLSPELFDRVMADARSPEEVLDVGDRVPFVTVVVSDLKNFTKLVRLASPDDLRDCMSDYYRRARRSVWQHGGVLEKFIGDAVLAIFNYPYPSEDAAIRALRFSRDLVALGGEVLRELSSAMVERVQVGEAPVPPEAAPRPAGTGDRTLETGTRIGIASGPIWVLDIGFDELEPSFIGDAMNRAARLESSSPLDGALLDQVTRHELHALDPAFADALALEPGPTRFRGLDYDITTWCMAPGTLADLRD